MSVNLQNDGIAAVKALRTHPAWGDFTKRLRELCRERSVDAIGSADPAKCGYAAALMHLCQAVESAETGMPQQTVKKPSPLKD